MNGVRIESRFLSVFLSGQCKDLSLIILQGNKGLDLSTLRDHVTLRSKVFSSFKFVDDLLYSIASESLHTFKKDLRDTDVFVLEITNDLKRKKTTQLVLAQTIESRILNKKKTIIFSRKRIKEISYLRKKLKRILKEGLLIEGV